MPYIAEYRRGELQVDSPKDAGELNYLLTMVCLKYLENNGKCYQTMNDIIGALEGCKLEFYRRTVAPYEDIKANTNGDVYEV